MSEIDRFNELYYDSKAFSTLTWLGVPILKCPEDLHMYQEILWRTRPGCIIETGCAFGGSSLFLASMCSLWTSGSHERESCEIVSVDVTLSNVHPRVRSDARITLVEGSSTDPDIVTYLAAASAGKRTMVILDSDHTGAHVLRELELLSPLVSDGCYLIVEDTNINGHPVAPGWGDGPFEAVERFLRDRPDFEIDRSCERLLLTFNPSGYLRRVPAKGSP